MNYYTEPANAKEARERRESELDYDADVGIRHAELLAQLAILRAKEEPFAEFVGVTSAFSDAPLRSISRPTRAQAWIHVGDNRACVGGADIVERPGRPWPGALNEALRLASRRMKGDGPTMQDVRAGRHVPIWSPVDC